MSAAPIMIFTLCVLAIAYRYYSAFLAAKVAVLDDTRNSVRITGGVPPYTVSHDMDDFSTWERELGIVFRARGCTGIVHTIAVESADGQSVSHDYYIRPPWCT